MIFLVPKVIKRPPSGCERLLLGVANKYVLFVFLVLVGALFYLLA